MSWVELLRREAPAFRIYEGEIATDANDVSDLVEVTIEAFDRNLLWGPAPWMPRVDDLGNTMYPAEGDRCVVALAETVDPGTPEVWIIGWWP